MVRKLSCIVIPIVVILSLAILWGNVYGNKNNSASISSETVETQTDAHAFMPSVSPDGSRVVFFEKRTLDELFDGGLLGWLTLQKGMLAITKIGSNSVEEVLDGRSGHITWTPDSSAFYCYHIDKKTVADYESKNNKALVDYRGVENCPLEILRVDVEPLKVTLLHKGNYGRSISGDLSMSPDGKYICFVDESNSRLVSLCIMDALAGTIIWEKSFNDYCLINDFSWAPYGHTICFSVSEDSLYLYNVNEGKLQKLVNYYKGVSFSDMIWLPDGKSIVFLANGDKKNIKYVHTSTKRIESICNYKYASQLELSPNGKRLVLYDSAKKCLILVDLASKRLRVLTKGKGYVDYPDRLWLSNSKIGFPMYSNPKDPLNTTFYVMDVDKNTLQAYKDAHRVLPEYSLAVKGKKATLTFWDDVRGKWRLFVKKFGV
jgi:Tol biopolymer transport system component